MSRNCARLSSLLPALTAMAAVVVSLAVPSGRAWGDVPDYDFDWVTIDHPNNPAYAGTLVNDSRADFGSVPYVYRMARNEVTTAQYLEFFNTFSARADRPTYFFRPLNWGAERDPTYTGPGTRFRLKNLPGAGSFPVGGISWYDAARFVNWLNNDKGSTLAAIADGAYDASLWNFGTGPLIEPEGHRPGARFWIPTLNEWEKAAHYDPDRYGPGQGGYWMFPTSSDSPPVPGLPGTGEANIMTFNWNVPVGSYPEVQSPWGLLDMAGGAGEWLEALHGDPPFARIYDGSSVEGGVYEETFGPVYRDSISRKGSWSPTATVDIGFRLASVVPTPTSVVCLGCSVLLALQRRRR